jgi:hypothetical protein
MICRRRGKSATEPLSKTGLGRESGIEPPASAVSRSPADGRRLKADLALRKSSSTSPGLRAAMCNRRTKGKITASVFIAQVAGAGECDFTLMGNSNTDNVNPNGVGTATVSYTRDGGG